MPVEAPLPLEEAVRLAVVQLLDPRSACVYEPVESDPLPPPASHLLPYRSVGDLVQGYKDLGLNKHQAWNHFVIDTILQRSVRSEMVNADEFMSYYK